MIIKVWVTSLGIKMELKTNENVEGGMTQVYSW